MTEDDMMFPEATAIVEMYEDGYYTITVFNEGGQERYVENDTVDMVDALTDGLGIDRVAKDPKQEDPRTLETRVEELETEVRLLKAMVHTPRQPQPQPFPSRPYYPWSGRGEGEVVYTSDTPPPSDYTTEWS